MAFACISDHITHDTVAVYVFVEKSINDYVKLYLPQLQKIHQFSDGSCAQYKNYKNFANLIFHVQDFGITAQWNFLATSLGKNLCDLVGGTVKRLATKASLQRPLDNQIPTSYQLFEFNSQNISGITSFYVDSETVKKIAAILEPRFVKAECIKGTNYHHQFVPEGSSMRMIFISGSNSNVDNYIVDTNRMDLNDITRGSYYACKCDNNLNFCIINQVSMEHGDVNVKFMHPKAPAKRFFQPDCEGVCWIPLNHMICRVKPSSSGSTARYYSFDQADIDQVLGYL